MRKTFLKWMLLFMAGAFIIAFFATFCLQTDQAAENAKSLILLKTEDLAKQLKINRQNLADIRKESDQNALAKARAFAQMIKLNPALVYDKQKLEEIRCALDVDELHVSDEKGILVGGNVLSYIGYDYASDPQSAAFLPAISDKSFELAQDPQPKGINKEMFQYVGVARLDAPGIVQIGYKPEKLSRAMEVADIKNLAPGFRIGKSGSVMVAGLDGKILSTNETAFLGRTLAEYGFINLIGEEGSFFSKEKKSLVVYKKFNDYIIVGQLPDTEMYLDRDNSITVLVAFNIMLFAVIFILIAILVQKVVINGIQKVNRSLNKITEGDLNEVVNVCTNAEFKSLSNGINTMVEALKAAIREVASRIDSELAFANAVQHSVLPSNYPAFPEQKSFDIHGGMTAAKKIGGDFYDFFMIGEEKLCFVIADVSDKGIPAALFMMLSKSLIKSFALTGLGADEVFYKSNNALCENNGTNMFVTAFIGILDLRTGVLEHCNAGHNPVLIKPKNGVYARLLSKRGLVLAGMPDTKYKKTQTRLYAGDKLFLYTDGVTEAMDRENALYGEDRLTAFLNGADAADPGALVAAVKADVDRFADGVEQADDITMLAITYFS